MERRLVIAGVSTRALAESARRAGFACSAVDAFADLDQAQWADVSGLRREAGLGYTAARAARAAARFDAPFAAYAGNLENHPAAVARLARGRRLLGNAPETLRAVRDPRRLSKALEGTGVAMPKTLFESERVPDGDRWLIKPERGGGGQGVREVPAGHRVRPGQIAQERVAGTLASVSFLADGRRAFVLGVAQGLAGDPAFRASGHRYCGSLFPLAIPAVAVTRLEAAVARLASAFGLRGLNGLDFVLQGDVPVALELNPRFSASMELIERAGFPALFAAHADACEGALPTRRPPFDGRVHGKAVLWADRDRIAPDTRAWLGRDDVRDVPKPESLLPRGAPVCSVFATGATIHETYAALTATSRRYEAACGVTVGAYA
jgi:predicted ATP-grasp superfamily ATP-dependent carboligase